jgi:hypothetical protein
LQDSVSQEKVERGSNHTRMIYRIYCTGREVLS